MTAPPRKYTTFRKPQPEFLKLFAKRFKVLRHKAKSEGMTLQDLEILLHFVENAVYGNSYEYGTQLDLAKYLGMARDRVCKSLNRLEKWGFLVRVNDSHRLDKRVAYCGDNRPTTAEIRNMNEARKLKNARNK